MDPTPLFTKTFDFVTWLMPVTNTFPRTQRFVVTQRLLDATLNFYELTLEANNLRMPARLEKLELADAELDKMRVYWRLALKWNWLNPGRYHHGAVMLTEIGKLLGGWQKALRKRPGQAADAELGVSDIEYQVSSAETPSAGT